MKKLPKVKNISIENVEVLAERKAVYAEYRTAREEMWDHQKAQRKLEMFFASE